MLCPSTSCSFAFSATRCFALVNLTQNSLPSISPIRTLRTLLQFGMLPWSCSSKAAYLRQSRGAEELQKSSFTMDWVRDIWKKHEKRYKGTTLSGLLEHEGVTKIGGETWRFQTGESSIQPWRQERCRKGCRSKSNIIKRAGWNRWHDDKWLLIFRSMLKLWFLLCLCLGQGWIHQRRYSLEHSSTCQVSVSRTRVWACRALWFEAAIELEVLYRTHELGFI